MCLIRQVAGIAPLTDEVQIVKAVRLLDRGRIDLELHGIPEEIIEISVMTRDVGDVPSVAVGIQRGVIRTERAMDNMNLVSISRQLVNIFQAYRKNFLG